MSKAAKELDDAKRAELLKEITPSDALTAARGKVAELEEERDKAVKAEEKAAKEAEKVGAKFKPATGKDTPRVSIEIELKLARKDLRKEEDTAIEVHTKAQADAEKAAADEAVAREAKELNERALQAIDEVNKVAHKRAKTLPLTPAMVISMARDIAARGQDRAITYAKGGEVLIDGRRRLAAWRLIDAVGWEAKGKMLTETRDDIAPDDDAAVRKFNSATVLGHRELSVGQYAFWVLDNWRLSGEPGKLTEYPCDGWEPRPANLYNAQQIDRFGFALLSNTVREGVSIDFARAAVSALTTAPYSPNKPDVPATYNVEAKADFIAEFTAAADDKARVEVCKEFAANYKKGKAVERPSDDGAGDDGEGDPPKPQTKGEAAAEACISALSILAANLEKAIKAGDLATDLRETYASVFVDNLRVAAWARKISEAQHAAEEGEEGEEGAEEPFREKETEAA